MHHVKKSLPYVGCVAAGVVIGGLLATTAVGMGLALKVRSFLPGGSAATAGA